MIKSKTTGGLPAQEHSEYMEYYDQDDKLIDRISLKFVAFASVVLGTITITACCVTVPLAFNYVQQIQSTVEGEFDYCKVRLRWFWLGVLFCLTFTYRIVSNQNCGWF